MDLRSPVVLEEPPIPDEKKLWNTFLSKFKMAQYISICRRYVCGWMFFGSPIGPRFPPTKIGDLFAVLLVLLSVQLHFVHLGLQTFRLLSLATGGTRWIQMEPSPTPRSPRCQPNSAQLHFGARVCPGWVVCIRWLCPSSPTGPWDGKTSKAHKCL